MGFSADAESADCCLWLVLSVIAKTPEDKSYYAKRAAEYEHRAVKNEIETAWLISQAMSAYDDDMQMFTDKLTGIDTTDYLPYRDKQKSRWQKGDEQVLLIDKRCLHADCLKQFDRALSALPSDVGKRIIIKADTPISDDGLAYLGKYPDIVMQRYDPIEHAFLGSRFNRLLHVRQRTVITGPTESAHNAQAAQGTNHE